MFCLGRDFFWKNTKDKTKQKKYTWKHKNNFFVCFIVLNVYFFQNKKQNTLAPPQPNNGNTVQNIAVVLMIHTWLEFNHFRLLDDNNVLCFSIRFDQLCRFNLESLTTQFSPYQLLNYIHECITSFGGHCQISAIEV